MKCWLPAIGLWSWKGLFAWSLILWGTEMHQIGDLWMSYEELYWNILLLISHVITVKFPHINIDIAYSFIAFIEMSLSNLYLLQWSFSAATAENIGFPWSLPNVCKCLNVTIHQWKENLCTHSYKKVKENGWELFS